MATPAAVLSILVEANTSKATTALRTFDRSVARTGTTSKAATTRTSAFNKATGTLGNSLGRAARYASGAAVAYLSIAQAKSAVTTTQELAKTTAGLNRNLGLSAKTASKWGTVAKARDIDTKSLNMSFTTLSRRLTDAAKGSDSAIDSFADLGLSERDLARTHGDFNKQLLLVADAFGEAEGGAIRQQAAQKLLGRGYQTLLPMFASGAQGLKEQFGWADRYGTVLDKKAVKAQMELVNAQRESKVAMLGLQVSFTKALTPALEVANRQFQRLSAIMASDKLTRAEKFEKVGRIIARWGEKAFDAFVAVLPKMVEEAGEQAPRIAGALAKGFMNADIWGKVFLGGWLFAKMGGRGFFTGQGKIAGRLFAGGFLLALPTLVTEAYDLGKKVGHAIRNALGLDTNAIEDKNVAGKVTTGAFTLLNEVPSSKVANTVRERQKAIEKAMKESHDRQRQITWDNATRIDSIIEQGFGKVGETTKRGGKRQEEVFDNTREKLNATTRRQANQVGGNVASMVNKVGEGLQKLGSNTNKALQAFGAKKLSFAIESVGQAALGRQRGGMIPGTGDGDKVPVMAEPGEGFINKSAVKALGGKGAIDAINARFPRFQTGGVVGLQPGISRLVNWASDRYGLRVSSGLRPGDSGSLHSQGAAADLIPPSMTATKGIFGAFKSQLAELFYDPWGGYNDGQMIGPIGGHMDHIHAAILGAGSPAAQAKLKKILLKGPNGPLRSMGQGSLDKAHAAARRMLAKKAMTGHGDIGIGNVSGPLQSIAQRMIAAQWGMGQWPFFNDLVQRESGWDPSAVNPSSGAAGLAQALPPSKYPPGAWPYTGKSSAVKQLQWMVNYIAERYGNPAGAISWHNSHNWYGNGGDFIARTPQLIGVGDGGPERVQVTPLSKGGGGNTVVINGDIIPNPGVSPDEVVQIVNDMGIVEHTMRQGGRGRGRARQLPRG